jgi:hypothetical protein
VAVLEPLPPDEHYSLAGLRFKDCLRIQLRPPRGDRRSHGLPNLSRDRLGSSLADPPTFTEDEELKLPAQFAEAVALSTQVFTAMAKNHDQFVKKETVLRLNEKGTSRVFEVGEKVKVRVPPTQAQLLTSGRRAKHVTAWRGPCTILERLSTTAYAAVDDTTKHRYERVIANILPYKAARAKKNADASFSQTYSAPFSVGEFIAIRDEPTGPYYVALVQTVTAKCIAPRAVLWHHRHRPCGRGV